MERLPAPDRLAEVTEAAFSAALKRGWFRMTRGDVAEHAGTSEALVSHYLGGMDEVRSCVMKLAVQRSAVRIVAEGLAHRHSAAQRASDELKEAALATLL